MMGGLGALKTRFMSSAENLVCRGFLVTCTGKVLRLPRIRFPILA